MDANFHAAQDLIYAMQNTAPTRPIVTLWNLHKEKLSTLDHTTDE